MQRVACQRGRIQAAPLRNGGRQRRARHSKQRAAGQARRSRALMFRAQAPKVCDGDRAAVGKPAAPGPQPPPAAFTKRHGTASGKRVARRLRPGGMHGGRAKAALVLPSLQNFQFPPSGVRAPGVPPARPLINDRLRAAIAGVHVAPCAVAVDLHRITRFLAVARPGKHGFHSGP